MLITRTSAFGVTRTLDLPVTSEQMTKWEKGDGYVQDIFTSLNAGQREFIISGNTDEDWDKMFAENADTDV